MWQRWAISLGSTSRKRRARRRTRRRSSGAWGSPRRIVLSTVIREAHLLPDEVDTVLTQFCQTLREVTLAIVRDQDAAAATEQGES